MKLKLFLIIIPLLLSCDLVTSPEESKTYTFYGRVLDYDANTTIDSAIVRVSADHKRLGETYSDHMGEYIIEVDALPSWNGKLTAYKRGYHMPDEYGLLVINQGLHGSFGDKIIKKTDIKLKKDDPL